MQWESQAEAALKKVPIFVRKMVKGKIEEYAASKGRSTVSIDEVEGAHKAFMACVQESAKQADSSDLTDAGDVSGNGHESLSAHLEQLQSQTEQKGTLRTSFSMVKTCGASFGCPRQVVDPTDLQQRLAEVIEQSGYREFMESRVQGLILQHHKFRAALSGCPNGCSQPQIMDFAVIGRAIPEHTRIPCIECHECEEACEEGAIRLLDADPNTDYVTCVACGDCAAACPTGTLVAERRGYGLRIGGRLGRHPQLAESLVPLANEDEVVVALRTCIEIYMANAQGMERFASVVNRLGVDEFCMAVSDALVKLKG